MVLVAEVRVDDGPYSIVAQMVVMPRGITVTAVSPNYAHLGATAQAKTGDRWNGDGESPLCPLS